jgi:acetyltransferase-like isoleucine patch superfamily enzyme
MIEKIKNNPGLRALAHKLFVSGVDGRPRWWVRTFVTPFAFKRGKGTRVSRRARMDVHLFNTFVLGSRVRIEERVVLNNGMGPLTIDDGTFIGISNVLIGPVHIGKNVITAQHVVMSGMNHGYEDVTTPIWMQPNNTSPIVVEEGCWIGANVVVTAGVTIGKQSVIAGGAVVTRDIPPFSVAVGNPARVVKQFNHETGDWEKIKNQVMKNERLSFGKVR